MAPLKLIFLFLALFISTFLFGQSEALEAKWQKAKGLDSLGKHSQALKILDGLVNEPAYAYKAHMLRSDIYFENVGRHEDSIHELNAAMRVAPDSLAPYINRSSRYLSLGMPDRALTDLEAILPEARDASDSVTVLLNMSGALSMMRQFQLSVDKLDMALAIEPENWALLSNKAAALDDLDRKEEARDIYLRLHEMQPEEIIILNNLGFNASNRGEFEEALGWFQKAHTMAPDDPVVLNNLAYAQLKAGDKDSALRNVLRSIELYPANSYAYRNLGLIQQARGDVGAACDAFEQALAKGFTSQYGPEVQELRKEQCQ